MAPSERLVGRNFLKLGAGEIIARLLAFGGSLWLARALGAEMYGVVGVAMAVLLYFQRLADAGLDLVGMREVAADRESAAPLVQSILGFRILLALLLAALLAGGALLWLPRPDGLVLAVFALTLIPVGANTRFVHVGFERGGYAAAGRVVAEALILLLIVLLVRAPADALRVPLAHLLGYGVAAVLLARWMRAYAISARPRLDWALLRPILRRSAHVVGAALLGLIAFNSDLIILRITHGATTAGWYAAAYMPLSLALNIGLSYRMSLLPTLTRLGPAPDRQHALYQTSLAHVFAIVAPTALAGTLLAPQAIAFLFGGDYAPAGAVLQVLIWAIPLAALREPPIAAVVAAQREDRLLHQNAAGTAVNLALNLALIPRYGMMGAAAATVVTEAVRLTMALWFARDVGFSFAPAGRFWRAVLAAAVMTGALRALDGAHVLIAASAAVAVYAIVLLLCGGIRLRRGSLPALSV